ncbi:MAG: S41 family peptidase [Isosphaerales bacterium]
MRRLFPCLLASLFLAILAGTTPRVTRADEPAARAAADSTAASGSSRPEEANSVLERGLEQERSRDWAAAIETYHGALERWPSRADFSRRLRLCEIHFKLNRRYTDGSFRNILLRLPHDQAVELYDEVLERIQSNYVDPVPFEPLVRHGLDDLEVALRDPVFVKTNAPAATPEGVNWLREALRQHRAQLVIPDRSTAVRLALSSSELARQSIGMASTPVLLEFTCGACDALDDFTSYLTPDKLEDLYAMIDGNFVGLGIELKNDKEGLRLIGVIRGGPAWEAGLAAGELIVGVGGQPIKGLTLDEAANRLQGTEGTTVELEVRRRDGSTRNHRLVRRHVEVESVTKVKLVDPEDGIGYLQLGGFQKTSADEIDHAVEALSRQGMKILVLDLRGNPGGLLNVAVDIAERFIDTGLIVSTRGRAQGQTQSLSAHGRAKWRMPLYVLVDHDSASASEILAGALQDHQRATILGARTYGKGSVQSIFSLRSAPAGLKLTTAKFYSPLNRPYSEQGVQPDIPILARSSAKPAGDAPPPREESIIGDPELDSILATAIRTAKGRLPVPR